MRLGIGSYTYTWAIGVPDHPPVRPMTALDLLDQAQRLNVSVVQVCDNLPLANLNEIDIAAFEQKARQLGINIELGTHGLEHENLLLHLRLAQRFGCKFLRLVIDANGDEPTPEQAVARLKECMPEFQSAHVKLAIENHDRFSAARLARMIEQLGPQHAGICLDTANSLGALEGPRIVIETLAPYTVNLHIKDIAISRVSSKMGFIIEGRPACKGQLDIPWILECLRAQGRNPNAIIELWTPYGLTLEETIAQEHAWAGESVHNLRALIPG